MPVTIRKAKEPDFSRILELFHEFAAFEKTPEKMQNSLARMRQEKRYFRCLVVESENREIIGYVAYFFCYYTWSGKALYMDDLYIKPAYRGKGIGTRLIKKMIALAKKSNCHKLRWQVSGWNEPAIRFYKALGAGIDGTEHNCDLSFE